MPGIVSTFCNALRLRLGKFVFYGALWLNSSDRKVTQLLYWNFLKYVRIMHYTSNNLFKTDLAAITAPSIYPENNRELSVPPKISLSLK